MGSTKSGSPSYRSTKVEKPQASYAGAGQILATNSGTPAAGVGMPEMPKTQQQQLQLQLQQVFHTLQQQLALQLDSKTTQQVLQMLQQLMLNS